MGITFKLGDLVILLAVVLGAAACGYLVLLLARLAATIKNINLMLEANRQSIDNTLKSLPGIAENVNEITGSVRKKTEMIDSLLSGSAESDTSADDSLMATLQTAISSITTIIGIFNEIKSFFTPKKRIFKIRKKK